MGLDIVVSTGDEKAVVRIADLPLAVDTLIVSLCHDVFQSGKKETARLNRSRVLECRNNGILLYKGKLQVIE